MKKDPKKRKLSAILSADVVAYSRLMEADEAWTFQNLEENKKLIGKLIEEYGGRVIDAIGDNLLAEFSSVINSVECAVKIQQKLNEKNSKLMDDHRMHFRIGVNLGDVFEEDGRIYGSGVNIASRIEGLAEPGGICISGRTYDHIKTSLGFGYKFLGEHNVKNISEPIKIYSLLMESENAGKVIGEKKAPSWMSYKIAMLAVIILIIISVGLTGWIIYSLRSQNIESASIQLEQSPVIPEVKKDHKTIAILPFDDISPDKDQGSFVDGLSEEIINSLAQIADLGVTGRTSSFTFKGSNKKTQEIANELGVGHILEGSVRKVGNSLRITAQLIRAVDDLHLWSKTYDRDYNIKEILAIQDDIAKSVADTLQITLGVGELSRAPGMTSNIDAYNAYLEGRSLRLQKGQDYIYKSIEQLEKAVVLDPDFAICWYELATTYGDAAIGLIPERAEEFRVKQNKAHSRVVGLIPETNLALRITASQSGDRIEFERLYKKALALEPFNYDTNFEYGMFLNTVGRPSEAIEYFERLVRMEPLSVDSHFQLGQTYQLCGNSNNAIEEIKKAKELTDNPMVYNIALLILAQEKNDRALIEEYNWQLGDQEAINFLDKPKEALAQLKLELNNPINNNPFARAGIAVGASFFGDHELALQVFREIGSPIFTMWRPIHKEMRQLPGFKNLVREIGLYNYWLTTGKWGDFCRPVGDDDFECYR